MRLSLRFPLLRRRAPLLEALFPQIRVGNVKVPVPPAVLRETRRMRRSGVSVGEIVETIAKSDWAQSLARAFCLPERQFNKPDSELTPQERACINTVARRLAVELLKYG